MKKVKVATGSLNQIPLDWEGNRDRILTLINQAKAGNIDVLALPELCLSAYGCEDMFLSPAVSETAFNFLYEIAQQCQGIITCIGLPVFTERAVYNGVALIADGEILGITLKQNLAGDGIHYEPRWFKAWPPGKISSVKFGDREFPIGDLIYDIDGLKIGIEICEDAWVAQRPGTSLANRGADVIINPSASHFAFGKQLTRQQLVIESSRAFNVTYLYANLLGNEAGRSIYDGELLIASGGNLLQCAEQFSFADSQLVSAVIELNLNRMNRARSFATQSNCQLNKISTTSFRLLCEEPLSQPLSLPDPKPKEVEFTQAVSLGLFDYMRKSRSRGFVVSLSGGADSAAVALLVNTMIKLGVNELGLEQFAEKCSCFTNLPSEFKELEKALLTCVYQGTENSSATTLNAAASLAEALNAEFFNWDVSTLVQGYSTLIEDSLKRKLEWEKDDIPLQNIQARVRAPGVWMMANIKNALLLATSNRSEAAVGYATMDGDTCGGLSPIAGIDKQFLRHWLRWMEKASCFCLKPYTVLSQINSQQPTAELRPEEQKQTDEEDLMPYEILDFIETLAIRDKMMPGDICTLVKETFPDQSENLVQFQVKRFFSLWCRNQWKRERYAPSFHLDDKNLDPKTWCRFPILNSGFRYELSKL